MNKTSLKNIAFMIIGIGGISLFAYVLGVSICPFYRITGVPCPSCGMTRACVSLMHFNLSDAFMYNPSFIFLPILFIPAFFNVLGVNFSKTKLKIFYISILAFVIVIWIIRLIKFFPHTEPMTYNYNSTFYKVYSLIKK